MNEEKRGIEQYFRTKYPDKRYKLKNYYKIGNLFGCDKANLYVIEFIDTQMEHPKTLELQVKSNELNKERSQK